MNSSQELVTCQNIYHVLLPLLLNDYRTNTLNTYDSNIHFHITSYAQYASLISHQLLEIFPSDILILPETYSPDVINAPRVWFINPIKGSGNYVAGIPLYFTTLSLWQHGSAEFTFIIDYFNQVYYWTDINQSTVISPSNSKLNSNINQNKITLDTNLSFESSSESEKFSQLIHRLNKEGFHFLKLPDSLGLIYTSLNKYPSYINPNFSDPITYFAAIHFLNQNHGQVTNFQDNNWNLTDKTIIASINPQIHNQLQTIIFPPLQEGG